VIAVPQALQSASYAALLLNCFAGRYPEVACTAHKATRETRQAKATTCIACWGPQKGPARASYPCVLRRSRFRFVRIREVRFLFARRERSLDSSILSTVPLLCDRRCQGASLKEKRRRPRLRARHQKRQEEKTRPRLNRRCQRNQSLLRNQLRDSRCSAITATATKISDCNTQQNRGRRASLCFITSQSRIAVVEGMCVASNKRIFTGPALFPSKLFPCFE
jgi:hypothetical protein